MRQRIFLPLILLAAGCASVHPAQLGQVTGMLIGTAVAPGVGAPVGGMLGTLAGLVFQGRIDKQTETKERTELGQLASAPASDSVPVSNGLGSPADALPKGPLRRVWVDESVNNGIVVAGHFEDRNVP